MVTPFLFNFFKKHSDSRKVLNPISNITTALTILLSHFHQIFASTFSPLDKQLLSLP